MFLPEGRMLRTFIASLILSGLALASSGCIVASSKGNRYGSSREVVSVNGRVYIIDTASGTAREIDLSRAQPFRTEDVEVHTEVRESTE